MRLIFAFLLALCLTLLPAAGGAWAGEGAATRAAQPCHGTPAPDDGPSDAAKACAEHCLMQVSAPAQPLGVVQPSVRNAVPASGQAVVAPAGLRNADAPDPRPPRG